MVHKLNHFYFVYEDLVTFVEETLKFEHALFPNRPIYLVGDSFGGCLALAVAARNPAIDLVVILSNPGQFFLKKLTIIHNFLFFFKTTYLNYLFQQLHLTGHNCSLCFLL